MPRGGQLECREVKAMPTGACRPEWWADERNEEGRPKGDGADSLTD